MSIHSEIRRLRTLKGWSMKRLAAEVSRAEGLAQPLAWQTVQQCEREPSSAGSGKSTAPTRRRLELVAKLLGTSSTALLNGHPGIPSSVEDLTGEEGLLLGLFRTLSTNDRAAVMLQVRERSATYAANPKKLPNAA